MASVISEDHNAPRVVMCTATVLRRAQRWNVAQAVGSARASLQSPCS
jgi:hypothetical protein